MNRKKVLGFVLAAVTVFTAILTGCTKSKPAENNPTETTKATTKAAPVELSWNIECDEQKDADAVSTEVSKYIKDKINATIKLNFIPNASYKQKIDLKVASGEEMDILSVTAWSNPYSQYTAKGVYLDITDKLDTVAPKLKTVIPAKELDACRINGKLYAIPIVKELGASFGFMIRKDLVEKTGFDVSKVKSTADLTPFLEAVHKLDSNISSPGLSYGANAVGFYQFGDGPGAINYDDKTGRVVNVPDQKAWIDQYKVVNGWYKAGLVTKEATVEGYDWNKAAEAGKIAAFYGYTKPYQDKTQSANSKFQWLQVDTIAPHFDTADATTVMEAIAKSSKNADTALKFLELMNTDPVVSNMVNFGIEGKHYVKQSDGSIDFPEGTNSQNSTYNPNHQWMLGNTFITYIRKGTPADIWDKYKAFNESAQPTPTVGLVFNAESVKTELAALSNLRKKYGRALDCGAIDPADLPKIDAEYKAAGSDKVIAEKQKQVDAFLANKK